MIKSLTIVNPKGETLDLELSNPEKSGLIVEKVEGLGPPKATINGQELATSDGMIYSSARAQTRQVIFTLRMYSRDRNSKYGELSIEKSRHLIYQFFPLKKEITIYIHTDTWILYCKGYVESSDPNIFSKSESAVISVLCTDPWMYTEGEDSTLFSGIKGAFEFPFECSIEPAPNRNLLDNGDFRYLQDPNERTSWKQNKMIFSGWSLNVDGDYELRREDDYLTVWSPKEYDEDVGELSIDLTQNFELTGSEMPYPDVYTLSLVYMSSFGFQCVIEYTDGTNSTYEIPVSPKQTLYTIGVTANADIEAVSIQLHYPGPQKAVIKLWGIKLERGYVGTLARQDDTGDVTFLVDEIDQNELLEFGTIWLDSKAILDYRGTVDTGILITIHAFGNAENIRIYNVDTREQMIIDTEKIRSITGTEFGSLDDIIISTVRGNRYCRLLRGGQYTNVIGALSRDTDWFQISQGNNGFAFTAEKGADNLSVTFSYQNAYVGI